MKQAKIKTEQLKNIAGHGFYNLFWELYTNWKFIVPENIHVFCKPVFVTFPTRHTGILTVASMAPNVISVHEHRDSIVNCVNAYFCSTYKITQVRIKYR